MKLKLDKFKVLNEEEMASQIGGSAACKNGCRKGCYSGCLRACYSGNMNGNNGSGNTVNKP